MLVDREAERIRQATRLLRDAERPVRILRTVAWPEGTRERFFAAGESELPEVAYTPLDPAETLEILARVRQLASGANPIDTWLRRVCRSIELGALMLAAVGTPDFTRLSIELYGAPRTALADQTSTSLELARQLLATLWAAAHVDLGGSRVDVAPEELAERIRRAVERHFGGDAPNVVVVPHLSANALAGPGAIRIRAGARFSDRDVQQLVQHEAFIHIATSLNGRSQEDLPILAAGHPGTTRTQEGLAVFAEFITGSIEPARLMRLADRVVAIQMALDGASFLDVYRYFLEQTGDREQAFENTRRIFRGGVVSGGAPFTKDVVYLDGLLRVHNFLRSAVAAGRSDCLKLLFCGKLDIEDIPALAWMAEAGLCKLPRYMPPWASDLGFLVAYLAYSRFLNQVDLDLIRKHYSALLGSAPIVGGLAVPLAPRRTADAD
jgi:uncharacterized protein (TIGR02421 family)